MIGAALRQKQEQAVSRLEAGNAGDDRGPAVENATRLDHVDGRRGDVPFDDFINRKRRHRFDAARVACSCVRAECATDDDGVCAMDEIAVRRNDETGAVGSCRIQQENEERDKGLESHGV